MSTSVRRCRSLISSPAAAHDEPGGAGQHAAQGAADVPGPHHEDEAGEGERDGRPLQAAEPLAEEDPGQEQQPERHRVREHRDLAGASRVERDGGQAVEQRRLQEADRHRPREGRGPQRPPRDDEHEEEAGGARRRDEGDVGERSRVVERDLDHDPAVAPDGRDDDERQDAQVASAVRVGVDHARILSEAAAPLDQGQASRTGAHPRGTRRSRYTCPPRGPLAQLGERRLCTAEVRGSTPLRSTTAPTITPRAHARARPQRSSETEPAVLGARPRRALRPRAQAIRDLPPLTRVRRTACDLAARVGISGPFLSCWPALERGPPCRVHPRRSSPVFRRCNGC